MAEAKSFRDRKPLIVGPAEWRDGVGRVWGRAESGGGCELSV